jgi:hypothetical protein
VDFSPFLTAAVSHILRAPELSSADFASMTAARPALPSCAFPSSTSGVAQIRERDRLTRGAVATAGQPFLLNSFIDRQFATAESIAAKSAQLQSRIAALELGQFQADWAIATVSGVPTLFLCRPPRLFAICDHVSAVYESADAAFAGGQFALVCYRHSYFFAKRRFAVRRGKASVLLPRAEYGRVEIGEAPVRRVLREVPRDPRILFRPRRRVKQRRRGDFNLSGNVSEL